MIKKFGVFCLMAVVLLAGCAEKESVTPTNPAKSGNNVEIEKVLKEDKYVSEKLGFEITFPASWKDKYIVLEKDRFVEVEHITKPGAENTGNERIFTIVKDDTKENYEKAKEEVEIAMPYKLITQDGNSYYSYYLRTDVAYVDEENETEFKNMTDDVDNIMKTFKITGKPVQTVEERVAYNIEKLKDKAYIGTYGDGYTWYTAAEELGMIGKPAIPALIQKLDTKDDYERTLVFYALLLATQHDNVKEFTKGEYINTSLDFNVKTHPEMKKQALAWWEKYKSNWK